ncbi:MAG: hypothetical protein Q9218_002708 [Villophora microphyllina]
MLGSPLNKGDEEIKGPDPGSRKVDILALGLTSSTLLSHCIMHISRESSTIGAWAGMEIACTGTYLEDLPASFTNAGFSWSQRRLDKQGMCDARQWNWATLSDYQRDEVTWDEALEGITDLGTGAGRKSDEIIITKVRAMLWQATSVTENMEGSSWVLRNLDKNEIVRLLPPQPARAGCRRSACVVDHSGEEEITVDNAILARICWSYQGGQLERWAERSRSNKGVWAGDRFDIIYYEPERSIEDGWLDVTEAALMKKELNMFLTDSIWVCITLVICIAQQVSSAVDNIDPAQADPRGQITCLGDSYPLKLPMIGDFDPNRLTMQQICAKTQYHGGPPGQHIGGYCAVEHPSTPVRRVVFGISANSQVNPVLSNARTMLGWLYRTGGYSFYAGFASLYISQDKQNNIECRGALPPFGLPPPYTIDHFANLQELCASRLSGGYPAANAGGYCHRSAGSGAMIREVWFSDEITPRYEWTWNNFIASLGIRFYCYQRCACTFRPSQTDNTAAFWMKPQVKIWRFLNGYEASQNADGSLTYGQVGASSSSGQVLPAPSQGGTQRAGTCGAVGTAFCPSPWPKALLGPIQQMQEPPDPIIEAVKPRPGSHELTTCGSFCKSVLDCGRKNTEAAASDTDCTCATPSAAQSRYLGLDAVVPAAVCLALMAVPSVSGPLHGRDFVRDGGRLSVGVLWIERWDCAESSALGVRTDFVKIYSST